ncbi:MAG: YhcH/YjgK/YiaL family protein [Pirellulaceae bacterium]
MPIPFSYDVIFVIVSAGMILDHLDNCSFYLPLHPEFRRAFEFLSSTDFSKLDDGKYPFEDSDSFVIVSTETGRGKAESPLEVHRHFIDIQFVLSGNEVMGWRNLGLCHQVRSPYNTEKDIGFYADFPSSWIEVPPGNFAIFFPTDAHAPLAGQGSIRKAIVKVSVR